MGIQVTCEECFTKFSVASQHAGKTARCKTCGARVRIPLDDEDDSTIRLSEGPALSKQEVEELTKPLPRSKPVVPKKRKKSSRSHEGSAARWSGIATVLFLALFGLRHAGRISRIWKNVQGNQAATAQVDVAVHASPQDLYSLTDNPIEPPAFDAVNFQERRTPRGVSYLLQTPAPSASPGALMQLNVHLPPGEHQTGSLPCVLVAPAGSPMFHGNPIDAGVENPEAYPYQEAGYAVVEFSLDGWVPENDQSDATIANAYAQFAAAYAGMKNADAAFRFAANNLPMVNRNRIYIAGHSSAGTLSLLFAAHQPQLAGAIAYAPQVDVEGHLRPAFSDPAVMRVLPGLLEFTRKSSPLNHVHQVRVPLFIYHSTGDTVTSAAATRKYCDLIRQNKTQVLFVETAGNDHYQDMISTGLPAGINWLASQTPGLTTPASSPFIARNTSEPAPPASSPFRPKNAAAMPSTDDNASPFRPAAAKAPDPAPDPAPAPPPASTPPITPVAGTGTSNRPAETRPVDASTELSIGMRLLAERPLGWEPAEVVDLIGDGRVKVHFLRLPSAFDATLVRSSLAIPLGAKELAKDALETLRFDLLSVPQGGEKVARPATEKELLALTGYVEDSLQMDIRNRRISLQVVKGSDAESQAQFALIRANLFVRPFVPTRRR